MVCGKINMCVGAVIGGGGGVLGPACILKKALTKRQDFS